VESSGGELSPTAKAISRSQTFAPASEMATGRSRRRVFDRLEEMGVGNGHDAPLPFSRAGRAEFLANTLSGLTNRLRHPRNPPNLRRLVSLRSSAAALLRASFRYRPSGIMLPVVFQFGFSPAKN